jgi:hypothetical protein
MLARMDIPGLCVEIPKWVVDDKEKLDLLHGVLLNNAA